MIQHHILNPPRVRPKQLWSASYKTASGTVIRAWGLDTSEMYALFGADPKVKWIKAN